MRVSLLSSVLLFTVFSLEGKVVSILLSLGVFRQRSLVCFVSDVYTTVVYTSTATIRSDIRSSTHHFYNVFFLYSTAADAAAVGTTYYYYHCCYSYS